MLRYHDISSKKKKLKLLDELLLPILRDGFIRIFSSKPLVPTVNDADYRNFQGISTDRFLVSEMGHKSRVSNKC